MYFQIIKDRLRYSLFLHYWALTVFFTFCRKLVIFIKSITARKMGIECAKPVGCLNGASDTKRVKD